MSSKFPKKVHFVGIGGIGMSGLASLLTRHGVEVTGSDLVNNKMTDMLAKSGVKIHQGHSADHVKDGMTIIYSSSIDEQNPEFQQAKKLNCPILHRSDLLNILMQDQKSLAVTGTHGKTTTTSLLAHVLESAGEDPSYIVGGVLRNYNTNAKEGGGVYLVAEADESDGSFLKYAPEGAIITGIDNDHMDFYKNKKKLFAAFEQFACQVKEKKLLIGYGDSKELKKMVNKFGGSTYGFGEKNDAVIKTVARDAHRQYITFEWEGKTYEQVELSIIGPHNALNALAVFMLATRIGIAEDKIREAFISFEGVKRRCEKKGEINGITFIDDYAHHPSAVRVTLRTIRAHYPGGSIIAVFQPHRFSRMKHCMKDFTGVFLAADKVILTDIYASGEKPIKGVSIEKIAEAIGPSSYCPRARLPTVLAEKLRPGDVVVTFGAGDITKLTDEIFDIYKSEPPTKLHVGIIHGGNSVEHDVSMMSAPFVLEGLENHELIDAEMFHIDREGYWSLGNAISKKDEILPHEVLEALASCDLVFPVVLGPNCEDGVLQGFLKTLQIPHVGSGVAAGAVAMDKALAKHFAKSLGIKTAPSVSFLREDWIDLSAEVLQFIFDELKFPLFVKGVHLGSTIGVYRVDFPEDLPQVIEKAFEYDNKLVVENGIKGREIEFLVSQTAKMMIPPPAEVLTGGKVHDYEGKYSANGNPTDTSPQLTKEQVEEGRALAARIYQTLGCAGFARIDFFLTESGEWFFNEINPMPGLTPYSAVPAILKDLGIPSQEFVVAHLMAAMKSQRHMLKLSI